MWTNACFGWSESWRASDVPTPSRVGRTKSRSARQRKVWGFMRMKREALFICTGKEGAIEGLGERKLGRGDESR